MSDSSMWSLVLVVGLAVALAASGPALAASKEAKAVFAVG